MAQGNHFGPDPELGRIIHSVHRGCNNTLRPSHEAPWGCSLCVTLTSAASFADYLVQEAPRLIKYGYAGEVFPALRSDWLFFLSDRLMHTHRSSANRRRLWIHGVYCRHERTGKLSFGFAGT